MVGFYFVVVVGFFFHGNAKEPSQQKKVYQCFPTAITIMGVCLFACHVLFNLISVTIILHVKWVPAMFLL